MFKLTVLTTALMATFLAVPFAQTTPAAADRAPADIGRLAWIAGCWVRARPDGQAEEQWMKPSGGTMLGMSRTVRAGKTTEFEFLQIRDVDGALAYVAKPSGQAEATFPVKSLTEREVVFENLKHDFPHRVIYRHTAEDGLAARIEGEINGKARGVDFPFTRCP
jgi:hypothetical protein